MQFWRAQIDPDINLHDVMIIRGQLIDPTRHHRVVKIKIYYPIKTINEKMPVIFWSHGLGGSVDGAAFLSRFLSSHEYVVIHMQHHGTDSSLWEGKEGHPWDIIRATKIPRDATLNRFADVPFVLDHIVDFLKDYPDVLKLCDWNSRGMSGHSFGALTTQVMAGMRFPDKKNNLLRLQDSRFRSGILYSPNPGDHLGDFDHQLMYQDINIPLMHITGTDDSSPVEEWDYTKRLQAYKNINQADQYLSVLKHGDHMVFNGSRGKLGQSPYRDQHETMIKIIALSFWDMTLKNDQDAKSWLQGEAIQDYFGEKAEYMYKLGKEISID